MTKTMYILFSSIQDNSHNDDARPDDVIERDLLAKKSKGKQHHKYKACAFEHIGGTEFNAPEYLLPTHGIYTHHTDCTTQPKQVLGRHKSMLRCVLCENSNTRVQQVDCHKGTICNKFGHRYQ